MKNLFLCFLLISGPALAAFDDEQQALKALQDPASPRLTKEDACRFLKRAGTSASVSTLAALLSHERLWQWALNALETMPDPLAGDAIYAALHNTSGKTRAAIIHALAERRDRRVVKELIQLLGDRDTLPDTAKALARIGGRDASQVLRREAAATSGANHAILVDALLQCAEIMLSQGDLRMARSVYLELYEAKERTFIRAAAYRGFMLTAGNDALALACKGLRSKDEAVQKASLLLAQELRIRNTTKALAATLPALSPTLQPILIGILGQRDDVAAQPALVQATASKEAPVRLAALKALGEIGDASAVALIASFLATGTEIERAAAEQALVNLRRGDVCTTLLKATADASPEVQVCLVRVLVSRAETRSVSRLLAMAEYAEPRAANAAVKALQTLADDTHAQSLIELLMNAKTDASREGARLALISVASRSSNRSQIASLVVGAIQETDIKTHCSLLSAAGAIGGREALEASRHAAKSSNEQVRDAAVRALAENPSIDALPDLLALARKSPNQTYRVLAMRGYWRAVAGAKTQSLQERLKQCREGIEAASRPDEKRMGLVELAKLSELAALQLAHSLRSESGIQPEAELACLQIARSLLKTHPTEAEAELKDLAETATNSQARTAARESLKPAAPSTK